MVHLGERLHDNERLLVASRVIGLLRVGYGGRSLVGADRGGGGGSLVFGPLDVIARLAGLGRAGGLGFGRILLERQRFRRRDEGEERNDQRRDNLLRVHKDDLL
ncbi:MAG: hypothetical protein V8Q84_11455 [Bilophila sp.]